ncbi:hypothetical protein PEC301879_06250 [Pectobacterium carotovorum subsp. carotovorum]|nr:hypothetical protein PEC301879_06250 [Pectobacterium carotovorum subsp. carotovorum]
MTFLVSSEVWNSLVSTLLENVALIQCYTEAVVWLM